MGIFSPGSLSLWCAVCPALLAFYVLAHSNQTHWILGTSTAISRYEVITAILSSSLIGLICIICPFTLQLSYDACVPFVLITSDQHSTDSSIQLSHQNYLYPGNFLIHMHNMTVICPFTTPLSCSGAFHSESKQLASSYRT